ncbi:GNAT family N-acetyltransferase [Gammaproteobacteria bacterium]|nr:GNAT family N-acetyltransferase [Gammaproteobacteria bacterium]
MEQTTVKILHGIHEIEATKWDSCASASPPYNPFLSHKFLLALEQSKSVAPECGWQPFHLLVENADQLIGVVPMYLKSHSQGEYVFDYGWADAWQRAGGQYYPKLQSSVPFTPATGPRLLALNPNEENLNLLLNAAIEVAQETKVSSLHMTFMPKKQWDIANEQGFLSRIDQQFHWHNAGYQTFDDFLADLASKKRKNLKRERRDALENGISIEWATGDTITEEHWEAFYRFYVDTGARKWGTPYLTRDFFSLIGETLPEDILLIMAKRNNAYIAGALNFIGGDTLFGRNWGCIEDHRFLHFEVCYYQAIDFAIQHNLKKVEAGAQGSHKVARGYLPQATYSAHWISDPNFKDAVKRFLDEERRYVEEDIAYIEGRSPFSTNTDIEKLRSLELKS